MSHGSTTAVYTALGANVLVMLGKFVAFAFTGSGAMLSEGIHSFADVSNQALLALGIHESDREPDAQHPYGYGRARYFWALVSAVGIFFVGCGVTVYHGITTMLHPHEIEQVGLGLIVLGVSALLEGFSLWMAIRAVRQSARAAGQGTWHYIRHGTDPMGVAVLLEDGVAVLGIGVAASAMALALWTGEPRWDAAGSIIIGLLLGWVAIFLINKNRQGLLGMAMSEDETRRVLAVLQQDPAVEAVDDVKTTVEGEGRGRFKAEIDFDGAFLAKKWLETHSLEELQCADRESAERFLAVYAEDVVTELGVQVDRLEREIREAVPGVVHVDLETD